MDKYNLESFINRGKFAIVYLVHDKINNCEKALKKFEKRKHSIEFMNKEKCILDILNIPNETFKHKQNFNLVMPYYGKRDLYELYSEIDLRSINYYRKLEIVYEILDCIKTLNEFNIIHADIKMENFVVCHEFPLKLKIIDFGLSEIIKEDEEFVKCNMMKGTREYVSPEMFYNKELYRNSDLFSVGVLVFSLWTNAFKYNPNALDPGPCLFGNFRRMLKYIKNIIPEKILYLLKSTLAVQSKRTTVDEILKFDIFKSYNH